ncbi:MULTISPECIES: hypothetical protein [unclassified Moraxella]|uniref:hypothetical protein n=1 Tax=unclassified Moraxella TaxID=2685852 RepID=UPI00359D562D
MSDVNSISKNNIKLIALGVALALHGLVAVGLAKMEFPELKTLKITPPIKVEIIEPVKEVKIEQVLDEVVPMLKPIKPITAPKVEKNPDPRPPAPKPKAEPVKEQPQLKPPPSEPRKQQEPQLDPQEVNRQAEILAKQQAEAQARWEAQQRAEAERQRLEKAAAEAARQKAEAEAKARAEADARAKAEADAKARAEAEAAAKANNASNHASNQIGRGTGTQIGDITISAAKANASWRRKPNFSNVEVSENAKVGTISFTVHLKIDEKGRIISATGVNTGLGKNVDRQIIKAIRAASFNPFKDERGNPARGTAVLPMSFNIR